MEYIYDDIEGSQTRPPGLNDRRQKVAAFLQEQVDHFHPVVSRAKNIAQKDWGKKWVWYLHKTGIEEWYLQQARKVVRCDEVIDCRVTQGRIDASVYDYHMGKLDLSIEIPPLEGQEVADLGELLESHFSSLMSLTSGELPESAAAWLEDLSHPLWFEPDFVSSNCDCSASQSVCVHALGVLYAFGVLIDQNPQHLFTFRGIDLDDAFRSVTTSSASSDLSSLEEIFGVTFVEDA